MIKRYTRPEMGQIWREESRFSYLLEVEKTVAAVQSRLGIIPRSANAVIQKKSKFSVERIHELEARTKHDVIAFVSNLAENVGPEGRFLHFGMTSSDVLDTALSLQIGHASRLVSEGLSLLEKQLFLLLKGHRATLCAGRTHGMHAEPTTFGLKMGGFLMETSRNHQRFVAAANQCMVAKLSGAVGTYSSQPLEVEKGVAKILGLRTEDAATQVIPRDRHAVLMQSLALIGAGLERLAVEIRHLQRSEVGEVFEGFSSGQKGSSAMPHKRNPIGSENLTGAARLLRSYAQAAIENIALWHERDISHSSVERVIFPDAFILVDYALDRMTSILKNLEINKDKMKQNMGFSKGQMFSSHVLLKMVEKGQSREEAYQLIQASSHGLKDGERLDSKLKKNAEVLKVIKTKDIDEVFSGKTHLKSILGQVKRLEEIYKQSQKKREAFKMPLVLPKFKKEGTLQK